jgi:hypothetical protein
MPPWGKLKFRGPVKVPGAFPNDLADIDLIG